MNTVDSIRQDLRYGIRHLRLNPGFTLAAVLSLALGIGANTAIFTLFDQIVLRLLPVHYPRELVQLRVEGGRFGSNSGDGLHTSSHPLFSRCATGTRFFQASPANSSGLRAWSAKTAAR